MSYSPTNMRRLHRVSVDRVAIVVLDPNFKHATVGVDEHSNHKVSQNAWKQPCLPSEGSCTC
jgi:hypothetical protein